MPRSQQGIKKIDPTYWTSRETRPKYRKSVKKEEDAILVNVYHRHIINQDMRAYLCI